MQYERYHLCINALNYHSSGSSEMLRLKAVDVSVALVVRHKFGWVSVWCHWIAAVGMFRCLSDRFVMDDLTLRFAKTTLSF